MCDGHVISTSNKLTNACRCAYLCVCACVLFSLFSLPARKVLTLLAYCIIDSHNYDNQHYKTHLYQQNERTNERTNEQNDFNRTIEIERMEFSVSNRLIEIVRCEHINVVVSYVDQQHTMQTVFYTHCVDCVLLGKGFYLLSRCAYA